MADTNCWSSQFHALLLFWSDDYIEASFRPSQLRQELVAP